VKRKLLIAVRIRVQRIGAEGEYRESFGASLFEVGERNVKNSDGRREQICCGCRNGGS
jgi:hypothetical protein